jgi:flagellar hook-length control protein FliK
MEMLGSPAGEAREAHEAVVPALTGTNAGGSDDAASSTSTAREQAAGGAQPPSASPSQLPGGFSASFAAELQRHAAVGATGHVDTAAAGGPAPDVDTTEQIVQAMRVQFRDGIGSAVLRLKPEHLGEVSISLRVEQQIVSATVHADVPAVRQWLESQEASLRNGLSEQGLRLGEFVVREDESRRRGSDSADQDDPQQRRRFYRQRRADAEPRFEVIV